MPPKNNPNPPLHHLTTILAQTTTEKSTSLHLISDSIAQQRQTASRAILLPPLTLTLLSLIFAVLSQHLNKTPSDWLLLLTTGTGCIATLLLFTRYITRGYLDEAERVKTWRWLYSNHHHSSNSSQNQNPTSNDPSTMDRDRDLILITKFGVRIIGTLVLRIVDTLSALEEHVFVPEERLRIGVVGNGVKVGVIRAWTVRLEYRGVGVGRGLLEAAVEVCRERGWRGPVLSEEHANSRVFGWDSGGVGMRERYGWAWGVLEDVRRDFGILGESVE